MIDPRRLARFEEKWIPEPNSGCHLWIGATSDFGHGVFWNGERTVPAHVFSCEAAGHPVPHGLFGLHRCDTPCCVNAAHIFAGTKADNSADMLRKKRHWTEARSGEASGSAKIGRADAEYIRREAVSRKHADIAAEFGVHKSLISHIVRGKIWVTGDGVRRTGVRYGA